MKVRISYTIDVNDEYREAIRNHYGEKGLATREEVRAWAEIYGSSCDADILCELEEHKTYEALRERDEAI